MAPAIMMKPHRCMAGSYRTFQGNRVRILGSKESVMRLCLRTAFVLLCNSSAFAQDQAVKHPVTFDDYVALHNAMTSWTITQTSRYRVAIAGAGITDWASLSGR